MERKALKEELSQVNAYLKYYQELQELENFELMPLFWVLNEN
jgi:hypothetical protein